jgi:peptidyl-prolyl cis-trans isomerase A (cyclophilin A)
MCVRNHRQREKHTSTMRSLAPLLLLAGAAADFTVSLQTDVNVEGGLIVINVTSAWAPLGAAHLQELLADQFYDGAAFFRVVPDFVVQFGIAGTPAENRKWQTPIKDDPVAHSNLEGTVVYATAGPNTRTSQLFINLKDNKNLDQSFAPFGTVVQGMNVVRAIYNPTPGSSSGVSQSDYESKGDDWIRQQYPQINFIKNASVGPA